MWGPKGTGKGTEKADPLGWQWHLNSRRNKSRSSAAAAGNEVKHGVCEQKCRVSECLHIARSLVFIHLRKDVEGRGVRSAGTTHICTNFNYFLPRLRVVKTKIFFIFLLATSFQLFFSFSLPAALLSSLALNIRSATKKEMKTLEQNFDEMENRNRNSTADRSTSWV